MAAAALTNRFGPTPQILNQPTASLALTVLVAGALATVAFDGFGQALSPLFGYTKLAPVPLAGSVLRTVTGENIPGGGYLLHLLAGLLAYPLGALIVEALRQRVAPRLPWIVPSALYGVFLWAFALYGMAHLIAGNPPFLGFTEITWVALVGHVLFAIVATAALRWRTR